MLRLTITDRDVVHVVARTADMRHPIPGSTRVPCDECDAVCWQAPGRPPFEVDGFHLKPARAIMPPITVHLCIPCARMHWLHATGRPLPI